MSLIEAATNILQFQYRYKGYGLNHCSSCGAQKTEDWDAGKLTETIEECSRSCPWKILREAIIENMNKKVD